MTINSHLKFHALLACIKMKYFDFGFFLRCTQRSVHGGEGRRESRVQTAYPHCHLLLMTADKLLMQIPSEQLQLPHPQFPLPSPYRKTQPQQPLPPLHTPWMIHAPLWWSAHSERSSFKPRQYPALQSHDSREQWFKQSRWRLWHPHAAKHMLIYECHLLELYNQTTDRICECMTVI